MTNNDIKQRYIDELAKKTKEAYEIAQFNSEKIIMKAVNIAHSIQNKLSVLFEKLNSLDIDEAKKAIENFIKDNDLFYGNNPSEINHGVTLVTEKIREEFEQNRKK